MGAESIKLIANNKKAYDKEAKDKKFREEE